MKEKESYLTYFNQDLYQLVLGLNPFVPSTRSDLLLMWITDLIVAYSLVFMKYNFSSFNFAI